MSSNRPTVGDLVVYLDNTQRTGVIIEDDQSDMPFLIELTSGGQIWARECEVQKQQLFTICASTTPMTPAGSVEGSMYLIPDVDVTKPIPNTGMVYGFAGTDDLKSLLENPVTRFLSYFTNPEKSADYQYIYYLRGKEIVQMINVAFGTVEEPFKPHTLLVEGAYYYLTEPTKVGSSVLPEGTILQLEEQEGLQYTGSLPYLFRVCNTSNRHWFGRVDVKAL